MTELRHSEWPRVERLLDELLDREPSKRPQRLSEIALGDAQIAAKLERLMASIDGEANDLFEVSIARAAPDLLAEASATVDRSRAGTRLGNYALGEVLGRGGMGVVYVGHRDDEAYEKEVAIKLLPRGLESPEAIRRSELERQVLARLDHPNIARLLDGGVTDEGFPYLVMEKVEGVPIDDHAEEHGLDLRARIELMVAVCEAVQSAHQNLVIHRDLKPGNILVDPSGRPKLLDFGIAKLIADDAVQATRHRALTPSFAAPEQLANRPVTTATDVYALGAVLFLLTTGTRPLEASGSLGHQAGSEAIAPASRVARTNQLSWWREVRGDIDQILASALAFEPTERYSSAAALADDLRRHLAGLPVEAQKPTLGYRLSKFVSRHRLGTGLGVAAGLAIVVSLALALNQATRARQQADRAERVAGLLSGLFADADPWSKSSGATTVRELLDRGTERVRDQMADDRKVTSELLEMIGRAYSGIGHGEVGLPLLSEVLTERRQRLGSEHPETALAMRLVGLGHLDRGEVSEAESLIDESLEIFRQAPGVDSLNLVDSLHARGLVLKAQRRYEEQESVDREILELLEASGQETSATAALALGELSIALDFQGRDDESLEIQSEALRVAEATLGREHAYTSSLRSNLGLRFSEAGAFEKAVETFEEALAVFETLDNVHERELVAPLANLGSTLHSLGDFEAARPHFLRAVEIARRSNSPDDFTRIGAETNLATSERELGNLDSAAELYRGALARFERKLGNDHQATARLRSLLGITLAIQGESTQAESLLRRALREQRESTGDPMSLDETLLGLGQVLVDLGKNEEARPLLLEALAERRSILPGDHWSVAEIRLELASLGDVEAALSATEDLRRLEQALPAPNERLVRGRRLTGDG